MKSGPIPAFTVAICTVNRLPFLRRAIDGALRQLEAFPAAQLWIIDNGSTDGTHDYLAALCARSERIHWAHEPRRGAYYARALAIERAAGDFLVFLDDDARPCDGWLSGLVSCLEKDDTIGIVGCRADPDWSVTPPAWLTRRHFDTLAIGSFEGSPLETAFPCFPASISLAMRLNGCARLFIADPRRSNYGLGRTYSDVEGATSELIGGEETDLCEIYARNGYRVIVAPQLRVLHHISGTRLTRDWFRRKFRGDGISRIRLLRATGRRAFGRHGWPMLAAYPLLLMLHTFLRPLPYGRFSAAIEGLNAKSAGAWHEFLWGPRIEPYPSAVKSRAG
jgi:GT2 family glycosyltransferase